MPQAWSRIKPYYYSTITTVKGEMHRNSPNEYFLELCRVTQAFQGRFKHVMPEFQ